MSWIYLALAVVLDVTGTVYLKLSQGNSRPLFMALMAVCYLASLAPMALALRHIEMSVAYTVWSALGTALAVAIGIIWFKEPASALKLASLGLIVLGLIFLNMSAHVQAH
jgi:small multidrug resistance pump